jgi:hypothetical protein
VRFFLIDRVIQGVGLYVYNMHYVVEKRFCNNIAPVRSRGGSLVDNNENLVPRQIICLEIFTISDLGSYAILLFARVGVVM